MCDDSMPYNFELHSGAYGEPLCQYCTVQCTVFSMLHSVWFEFFYFIF